MYSKLGAGSHDTNSFFNELCTLHESKIIRAHLCADKQGTFWKTFEFRVVPHACTTTFKKHGPSLPAL